MNTLRNSISAWWCDLRQGWDQFWFTPTDAATLGLIRILAGAMLLYTHCVWTFELQSFFGTDGWLSNEFVYRYHDSTFAWSHLYSLTQNPTLLWLTHCLALLVFVALMVGWKSRIAAVAAFLLTVSYAHRASGALFGLDQINGFLVMYLMLGPCGDAFSVDNWLRRKKSQSTLPPSTSANVAIRLIQVHLCIVYLFAGLGKLFGESWWDGTALWGAFANHEYQTLDMTWLATSITLVNVLTHVTLFWEVSYAALIWNRITRPIMLCLAIPLHLGIAVCMGMVTFGLVMLIANIAFVSPALVRRLVAPFLGSGAESISNSEADPKSSAQKYVKRRVKGRVS